MAEVSQVIEIKATPAECYEVITDFKNYPEFLKGSRFITRTASLFCINIQNSRMISFSLFCDTLI